MFVLSAGVVEGCGADVETALSHGENQKIYCISIWAIRLQHVGLNPTRLAGTESPLPHFPQWRL